ncbi:hypothetical protein DERP_002966 [Dermatophagoides pteronyssinus]|uniref:Uncharacterized protein n=1 Tax=Dermatophagoides pteronyssinus TaxID=6956 RepID=A0ABQ8JX54_DERPT|nr:hypothetical protein DERP_002966 [Dermatophagoides pteronyssinus]
MLNKSKMLVNFSHIIIIIISIAIVISVDALHQRQQPNPIQSLVLRRFAYPPVIHSIRMAKITAKFDQNSNQNKTTTSSINNGTIIQSSVQHSLPPSRLPVPDYSHYDHQRGLIILNRLVKESFLIPTWNELWNNRNGRRRIFSDLPTYIGKVIRGLTNLTMAIGRTINSENGNGSLSRLITHRLVGVSESLMGWVERSVDDLPSIPRLDAQECMKRSICEAHNQPKKYGAVGLIIQLFFPPYLDVEDANKIVSKYQLAARYGRGENANCAAQYDDCMVNVLDILQGAINMIF